MTRVGTSSPYAPRPGAAPLPRLLAAQTRLEVRLLLRNGEQLLLVAVIPALVLLLFSVVDTLGTDLDDLVPGVLALAVVSTAFTGQAIATGFERRYGVLKRLGASPLPRWALLASKTGAVLVVEALQVLGIAAIGFALGWRPQGGVGALPAAVVLLLLGTAACSGLALLMAGTLRAEATLAAANLLFLLLVGTGGLFLPLDRFPSGLAAVLALSPAAALADGLRDGLADGRGLPPGPCLVLLGWAVASGVLAARWFRWE
jgi:ABC-2 type transport system permease protein